MELKAARSKYHMQKNRAKARGIGWQLTFQQWLEWWGDDLDRRGSGMNGLQMQRFADAGPYALDNIRKGTPKTNARTRSAMARKRACEEAIKDKMQREMEAPCVKHEPRGATERYLINGGASISQGYAHATRLGAPYREAFDKE